MLSSPHTGDGKPDAVVVVILYFNPSSDHCKYIQDDDSDSTIVTSSGHVTT